MNRRAFPQKKKGRKGKAKKIAKKNNNNIFSKGRDALGFEPGLNTGEAWVSRSDWDADFPLTPSGKTTALKAVLLKGFVEAPLDKVSFLLFKCPIPFAQSR
jgi:hypothetical protein